MDKEMENLVFEEIDSHLADGRIPLEVATKLKEMHGDMLFEKYDEVQRQLRNGEKIQI